METAAQSQSSVLQLVPRRSPERERARLEDFEMIDRTRAALELLDSKWSVPVIILLASGMRRHARLVDNIPGLSKKVLTATLRRLERQGVVTRHVFPESPVRVEYGLTPFGWNLTEPLMALYEWAVVHERELVDAGETEREHGPSPIRAPFHAAPLPAA